MSDIRKANMCARGCRAFFLRNGFDFQDFLKNGIDVEKVRATGDVMALQVIKVVEDGQQ